MRRLLALTPFLLVACTTGTPTMPAASSSPLPAASSSPVPAATATAAASALPSAVPTTAVATASPAPAASTSPAATAAPSAAPTPVVPAKVSFRTDVAPILARSCAGCHAPGKSAVGDLAVFDAAGKVRSDTIVDGINGVISECESGSMPRGGRTMLSTAEVALLKRWRTEGLAVD